MPDFPRFRKPPVVETVLAVQFEPLAGFRAIHFGLLWENFREDFPISEEQPPLQQLPERFGIQRKFLAEPTSHWNFTAGVVLPRVLFKRKYEDQSDGRQIIQIQADRFVHNWARKSEAQEYPTYKKNRVQFLQAFEKFSGFIQKLEIGAIRPKMAEVTYINRIPLKHEQRACELVGTTFPGLQLTCSDKFLPPTESINVEQTFPILRDRGRLQAVVRGPVLLQDGGEVVDLRLTARVAPGDPPAVEEMLDIAHAWVVNGFRSLTSPKMHQEWEIQG